MWIDNPDGLKVGDTRFLVRRTTRKSTRFSMRERPGRDKKGRVRIVGELGTLLDLSGHVAQILTALGAYRVIAVSTSGERIEVQALHGDELERFLRAEGYAEERA